MKAPLPINETERLETLRRYEILDTDPERNFDDLTLLASHVCGTPIALISFVDENRQWFKSKVGMTETQTSRDIAFCAHGILQPDWFEVEDSLADEQIAMNPLVTGDPKIRFYAGAPLVTPDGHALGMLCVKDRVPRKLNADQKTALQALSRQVVTQLELRRTLSELKEREESLRERSRLAALETDVSRALTRGETLADMLRLCTEAIVQRLNAAFARIWTLNEREQVLELQASAGMYTHLNGPHGRVPVGKFKIGLIAEERMPHLTNEVIGDPRVGDQEWAKREGMVAFAGYPLLVEDRLVGVVGMFARYTLTDTTLQALASISNNIAARIERKRAETALRQSEAEFRALAEAMPQMVWITRPDGWNTYFSQQWMDYTGLTLDESLGHGWNKPFHPEDQQRAWDAWQHATATVSVYSIESRLRRADGVYRWWLMRGVPQLDDADNILKWFGTCTDIHELKSAELEISRANEALSESKRFAESIAENSTSIIYVFDVETRRNVYTNRSAAEILGYSSAQILELGDSFLPTIMHPEDLPLLAQSHARLEAETDGFVMEYEYRVKHVGGDWRWIWVRETVFRRRPNGTVWQVMGTAQDITQRKRAEAELEQAHQELVKASRQAGMAEVATGILHNVGNVLNSVNIASSCVADSLRKSKSANLAKVVGLLREHETDLAAFLTDNHQGRQIPGYLGQLADHLAGEQTATLKELAQLQKNIEHIKDIVNMQQSFAIASGLVETLQVTDLVEDALKMNASSFARHDIEVIREFENVPPVTVEKHKVLQILINLVRNAKHACDESNPPEKRLTLRVTNGNDHVRIAVCDNGIGIRPENLTRIFEHGFTTKKDGHGFGLHSGALAAREMGGSLTVQSDGPGQGAAFTLELPCPTQENPHE